MQALTEREVAQLLRCSIAALRRWRREGRGPDFVRVERLVRYLASDIGSFLEKNAVHFGKVPPPAAAPPESESGSRSAR